MQEQAMRIIEAATDSLVQAISWDSEIALKYSRYTTWLTAFCTAGIGILVVQSSAILERTVFGIWAPITLGMSSLLLIGGALTGAILRRALKESFSIKRQQMTLLLTQKTYLLAADPQSLTLEELPGQIWRREFLTKKQQESFRALERRDEVDLPSEKTLVVIQELTTGCGFLLLLIAAFPGTW